MIRKQFYLEPRQQERLARVAKQRRCTEAEVVREAIDALPEDTGDAIARLRAAGLLLEPDRPRVSEAELRRREREWEDVARRIGDIRLSEAVIAERGDY